MSPPCSGARTWTRSRSRIGNANDNLEEQPELRTWRVISVSQSTDTSMIQLYEEQDCAFVDYSHKPHIGKSMETTTHVLLFLGTNKEDNMDRAPYVPSRVPDLAISLFQGLASLLPTTFSVNMHHIITYCAHCLMCCWSFQYVRLSHLDQPSISIGI